MTLIASMLADMPELRLRVQAQHVPDQLGYCADCRDNIRWPCEVSRIAAEAERRGGPARRSPAGMPWSAPMAGSMGGSPQPYLPSPMSPAMSQPLPAVGALPSQSGGYTSGYGSGYSSRPAPAYRSGYGSDHLAGSAADPLSAPMYQGRYV